jgi:hypothetical protein
MEILLSDREAILNKKIDSVLFADKHKSIENQEEIIQKICTSYQDGIFLENLEIHILPSERNPSVGSLIRASQFEWDFIPAVVLSN